MSRAVWTGTIIGVALVGGLAYYLHRDEGPEPVEDQDFAEESLVQEPVEPAIRYPVPEAESAAPAAAPERDDSGFSAPALPPTPIAPAATDIDEALRDSLAELFGAEPVAAFLIPKRVIQRLVVFINSLDGGPVPPRVWPVTHVKGLYQVESTSNGFIGSRRNTDRYAPYIAALKTADAQDIVNLYFRYYPSFQRAYEEVGYSGRYFNDRLVQIIDHLLAAPEIDTPIELLRPKVLYQFADPALEQRSSGQKILMRMGADNGAVVKDKLREIRALLVARSRSE